MAAIDDDPIFGSIKLAIEGSHASDMKILELLDTVAERLTGHDAEVQELREGLAALSNRLESAMQLLAAYVADGPAGESVRVLRQP